MIFDFNVASKNSMDNSVIYFQNIVYTSITTLMNYYYSGKSLLNTVINNLSFEIPGYAFCESGTRLQQR